MKKIIKSSLLLVSLVTCNAFAVDITAPLQVSANLNGSCALSANNLDFGTMSLTSFAGNTQFSPFPSAIQLKCSKGTNFKLTLSAASEVGGSRFMTGADVSNNTKLRYELFFDRSQDYGNEDTNSYEYSNVANGQNINYKLTGAVSKYYLKDVKADIYSDNLTLVVTY